MMIKKIPISVVVLFSMLQTPLASEVQDAKSLLADTDAALANGKRLLSSRPTTQIIGAHSRHMENLMNRGRQFQIPSKYDACAAVGATGWSFWLNGMVAQFNQDREAKVDYPRLKVRYAESVKECRAQFRKE
jgi:hypothetical protein